MSENYTPIGSALDFSQHVLSSSKGRDKLCSFIQSYAKYTSVTRFDVGSSNWAVWRGIEESMSDGRKIFRFLKYLPEAAKSKQIQP